jgi:ribitol-5-phosphate 2-dehydrogenase
MILMDRIVATKFVLVEPYRIIAQKEIIRSVPKGFVLIKPLVASICKSEMLYFKGDKENEKLASRLPMSLLHEGVAEIIRVGRDVNLNVGAKVIVNPMIPCGECVACKGGIGESLCQESRYMASTTDGLSQSHILYPADRILEFPEEIEIEVAALTEPLSIALHAFESAESLQDDRVAIIGDGAIGYMITLFASYLGNIPIENLYLFGIVDNKLLVAKDFATIVNTRTEKTRLENLKESFDKVFEAVGGSSQSATIEQAIQLLKPAGKCIVLGLSRGKILVDINRIVNKGIEIKGLVRSEATHFKRVIHLIQKPDFAEKAKRIISKKAFIIKSPQDLQSAFRYADSENGQGRTTAGRVLVHISLERS